jgi:hypothetical protein
MRTGYESRTMHRPRSQNVHDQTCKATDSGWVNCIDRPPISRARPSCGAGSPLRRRVSGVVQAHCIVYGMAMFLLAPEVTFGGLKERHLRESESRGS